VFKGINKNKPKLPCQEETQLANYNLNLGDKFSIIPMILPGKKKNPTEDELF
jgi:hypothetical protein